jgi:hypothetical protein
LRRALEKGGQDRRRAEEALWTLARPAVRGFEDFTRSWEDLERSRLAALARLVMEERSVR